MKPSSSNMKSKFERFNEGTLLQEKPTKKPQATDWGQPTKSAQPTQSERPPSGAFSALKWFGDKSKSVLDTTSDFFFGSTGEAVGGLITRGIASSSKLYGRTVKDSKAVEFGSKLEKQIEPPSATDIGFMMLELYPGGGAASQALKRMPGGAKIAEGLTRVSSKLRSGAIDNYMRALAPTKEKTKTLAKKVAPEMIDRGIKFKTGEELAERASMEVEQAGKALSDFWEKIPENTKIKMSPVLSKLDELAKKYIVDDEVIKPEAVDAINKMRTTLSKLGEDVSAGSARKLRQILDEAKDFTKTNIDAVREKAERQAANVLREELAKDLPDLKKLNAEFNFWSDVKLIAEETSRRKAGQTKGLYRALAGLTGFGIGARGEGEGLSERVVEGFVFAAIGAKGVEFLKSPQYLTVSAKLRTQLADALARGELEKIGLIVSKMMAGTKNLFD